MRNSKVPAAIGGSCGCRSCRRINRRRNGAPDSLSGTADFFSARPRRSISSLSRRAERASSFRLCRRLEPRIRGAGWISFERHCGPDAIELAYTRSLSSSWLAI